MLGVKGLKVVIGLTSNDEIFFSSSRSFDFQISQWEKKNAMQIFLQLIYTALSRERKGQNNTV